MSDLIVPNTRSRRSLFRSAGMTAAGIAITSGAKPWGVVSAVVLSIFTNLLHSLMTAPQNAQIVTDAKQATARENIGNP